MRIRAAQLGALEEARKRRFEDGLQSRLAELFPDRTRSLGEEGTREWIRHGIDRAAAHDIRAQADVCRYVELMLILGRDFDVASELPWAREILASQTVTDSGARIQFLVDATRSALELMACRRKAKTS